MGQPRYPPGSLAEPELEPLRQRLRDMAQQEYAMAQAVPRIEVLNERAGRAQLQPDYLVGYGWLQSRQQTGVAEPLFRREMQALEEICQGRDSVRVCRIHAVYAKRLSGLLSDLDLPQVGTAGLLIQVSCGMNGRWKRTERWRCHCLDE